MPWWNIKILPHTKLSLNDVGMMDYTEYNVYKNHYDVWPAAILHSIF